MGLSEQIRQQLINTFKVEQKEHLQKISEGLLILEKNPQTETRQALLEEIFREAHSLKGAARAVGLVTIESLGHGLEDLLLNAKEGRLAFSAELFDLLYETLDAVESLVEKVESGQSAVPAKVLAVVARLEKAAKESKATQSPPPNPSQRSGEMGVERSAVTQRQKPEEKQESEQQEITKIQRGQPPSPDGALAPADQSLMFGAQNNETIRVSVNKLDALMAQFSELLGVKIRAEQRLAEVRHLQQTIIEWQKDMATFAGHRDSRSGKRYYASSPGGSKYPSHKGGTSSGEMRPVGLFVNHAGQNNSMPQNIKQLRTLNKQTNILYRELSNDTLRLSLIIDELQEEIKRVRMLPLATITATFGRMVRDLAREQNKQINLTIEGGETELDKRVLEQIKDPLIHLLRNAVDHGIDLPEARRQAGKPSEGQITLSALQQGNNVVITVRDDGLGLDIPAIRRSTVRRGLLSQLEADKLSDLEASMLIFNSGLSTRELITDISGRGVGLDVVRRNVEELHGTLEVSTEPEQGSAFILTLPLTLVSSRGLLVRVNNQTFVIPFTAVERLLEVERSEIASVEGRPAMTYQGKPVALAWLADLLELPQQDQDSDQLTIVIIAAAEKRLGLIVDSLKGEQEIVMKGFGKQLVKVGGIAGASVLGSGEVILVLHTADLIKLAARSQERTSLKPAAHHQEADQRKTILVVDDSITTRTLEKNILEAAGYIVKLAMNGEEALGLLMSANPLPDLVVSDVNMPKLDGFGLTSRIRQDSRYGAIPVILVTSLALPADKARGIEVGADAYIVKSSFDQRNLLETIEQLI